MSQPSAVIPLSGLGDLGAALSAHTDESLRGRRVPSIPGWIYKQYRDPLSDADIQRLDRLIALPSTMTAADRALVDARTSWPASRVVNGRQSVGVLIPVVPDSYRADLQAPSGKTVSKILEIDMLARPADQQAKRNLPPQQLTGRMEVCAALARVGALFERHGVVYLGWSYANVLWSVREQSVYVIDMDGCSFGPRAQIETPDWADPLVPPGRDAGNESDRYRLALLIGRCLTAARGDPRSTLSALKGLRLRSEATERVAELLIGAIVAGDARARPSLVAISAALNAATGTAPPAAGGVTGWKTIGRDNRPGGASPVHSASPRPSQRVRPPTPGGSGNLGRPPSSSAPDHDDPQRYLKGQCPERVRVGEMFSVLASIVREVGKGAAAAALKPFLFPPDRRGVVLVLDAPGLEVLSGGRKQVDVPPHGDSEPVMFELRATEPGPVKLGITAWADGTYLGRLDLDTAATRHHVWRGEQRDAAMAIDTTPEAGAVSLVVRHDPRENGYRFEFRDEDNLAEVACHLAYQPGPRVEQLISGLDRVAKGRAGFSAAETRDYLINAGVELWTELIPAQVRKQFWERQHRISQLTILSDCDAVPWELLYPLDPGHDAGFLVEQFPVTRLVFGRRPARSLSLSPAWFVVPQGSPKQAWEEASRLSQLLSPTPADAPVIGELTPLLELIRAGDFGLLHFACHNAFDAANGPAVSLDRRQFTPLQLNRAAASQALARTKPTVFINACRSAGVSPSYHQLDGWARKFLEAGAGAFIGSLWAVRDLTARDFASELYRSLQAGTPLGEAARGARLTAAGEPGDPTWLAYAVYGDPRATLRR